MEIKTPLIKITRKSLLCIVPMVPQLKVRTNQAYAEMAVVCAALL